MATLSLKVNVAGGSVTKTMQFDPSTIVFDACRVIREKTPEANQGNREYSPCHGRSSSSSSSSSSSGGGGGGSSSNSGSSSSSSSSGYEWTGSWDSHTHNHDHSLVMGPLDE